MSDLSKKIERYYEVSSSRTGLVTGTLCLHPAVTFGDAVLDSIDVFDLGDPRPGVGDLTGRMGTVWASTAGLGD